MKFHFGAPKNPLFLKLMARGYYVVTEDSGHFVERPHTTNRPITRLFGLSWRRGFFGFIRYDSNTVEEV